MSYRDETEDFTLHLHGQTAKALLASDDGDPAHAVWLPKSQVEWEITDENATPRTIHATIPVWLAEDKELI